MQQDLFDSGIPQATGTLSRPKKTFLERFRISLRFDHALLVGIVFIILFALFFSLGVENGKGFAQKTLENERQVHSERVESLQRELTLLQNQHASPQMPVTHVFTEKVTVEGVSILSEKESTAGVLPRAAEGVGAPNGKYTIQTLTYKTETAAQRQIARYKEMGLSSFVIPSGAYIQVCVNAFESRSKATQALEHMKIKGEIPSDAYVRLIPHG